MQYRLLTGATGLLGSYLLRDFLAARAPLAVLVRPSRLEDAQTRVDAVLAHFEQQWDCSLPRPVVLCGDITQPHLGLESRDADWVRRHCDRVLHSAASLVFHEQDGEPWLSNVQGVQHVLALCRDCGIRQLEHISTAYVSGLRHGRVLESELDVGQEFGNDYEKSKVEAERLVRTDQHLESFTIFRPSIIVGDSQTGYSSTFHGFYTPLRVAAALLPMVGVDQALDVDYLHLLGLSGHERKNFVPVDWVSESLTRIALSTTPSGQTYALVSRHPVEVDRLRTVFEAVVNKHREEIDNHLSARTQSGNSAPRAKPPSYLESFRNKFLDQFSVYRSYWRDDPEFDCSNTESVLGALPCPEMTDAILARLCRFALETGFGIPPRRFDRPPFLPREWFEEHGQTLAHGLDNGDARSEGPVTIGMVVTGPGGGHWTVAFRDAGDFAFVPGVSGGNIQVHTTAAQFHALVIGQQTLSQALSNGTVVLCGDQTALRSVESFFNTAADQVAGIRAPMNQVPAHRSDIPLEG